MWGDREKVSNEAIVMIIQMCHEKRYSDLYTQIWVVISLENPHQTIAFYPSQPLPLTAKVSQKVKSCFLLIIST